MTSIFYIYLAIQVALIAGLSLWLKFKDTPPVLRLIFVVAYVTMPVAIVTTGIASAVYLSDILAPLFLLYVLFRRPEILARGFKNVYFLSFFFLLFIIPFYTGSILYIFGHDILFDNGTKSHLIWFYRNISCLTVFAIGLYSALDVRQARSIIEMNLIFGAALTLIGLFNYFGPYNLSVFETILDPGKIFGILPKDRIGAGFMGLFRGSVGQWFATLALLAMCSYGFISKQYRIAALVVMTGGAVLVILCSSRAGLIGLVLGMSLIALPLRRKAIIFAGLCLVIILFTMTSQTETARERFRIIGSGFANSIESDSSAESRMEGWSAGVDLITNDMRVMFLGIAPANMVLVYNRIGLWGAHNEYLDSVLRAGFLELFCLLLVLGAMLWGFFKAWRRAENEEKQVLWGLISILLANCAMALTQNHLINDYATYTRVFYTYALYGALLGTRWNNEMTKQTRRSR